MAAPDYSGVENSIKSGYNAQRQKAASQEAANLQGQKDALARRAAALGNAPGGAFVKQEQQAGNESAQRLQQANAGIDDAQNAEMRGVQMTKLGQQFQTSEREAGQGFQTGMLGKQQDFAHSERLGGQDFTAGEAQKQRGFLTGEREATQGFQTGEREAGQKFQEGMLGRQQDFQGRENAATRAQQMDQFLQQMGLSKEQFAHEQEVDKFNEQMAEKMFNKKDMLEKIMTGSPLSAEGNPLIAQWGGIFGGGGSGGGGSGGGMFSSFGSFF